MKRFILLFAVVIILLSACSASESENAEDTSHEGGLMIMLGNWHIALAFDSGISIEAFQSVIIDE